MERRDFLRMAAAAAALAAAPRTSRAATARIDVLVNEPIGPITPDIYGHFVEHLGGVVYDGVWVGEGSKIPNTHGIRQALIDAMKKLPKGAIRWPGGCFADSYDWRDGTGPRDQRPRRTNFWAGGTGGDADEPLEVRSEPLRLRRLRALLPPGRQRAVLRRQPAQPAGPRLLPVGRVLQLAGRHDVARRPARARRREGSAEGPLLGRRQRELGLRRRLHRRGVRRRVPPLHLVGARLRHAGCRSSRRARAAAT